MFLRSKQTIDGLKLQNLELHEKSERLEGEAVHLREQHRDLRVQVHHLLENNKTLLAQAERQLAEKQALEEALEGLQAQIRAQQDEKQALQEALVALQAQIQAQQDEKRSEIEDLKAELATVRLTRQQSEQTLRRNAEILETAQSNAALLAESKQLQQQAASEVQALRSELDKLALNNAALVKQAESLDQKYRAALEAATQSQTACEQLVQNNAELRRQAEQQSGERQNAISRIDTLQAELDKLRDNNEALRRQAEADVSKRAAAVEAESRMKAELDRVLTNNEALRLQAERETAKRKSLQASVGEPVDIKRRPFFIFSLPKSGAQAFANALDRGYKPRPFGKSYPNSLKFPRGLHVHAPITPNTIREYFNGGWLHTHAPASFLTLDSLAEAGVKHIIVVRNPLDQVVAYLCHVKKHLRIHASPPGHPNLIYSLPMAPCRREVFEAGFDIDHALLHLVNDGYFESVLAWISDWARFRDPALSLVVRYEDLISDPRRELDRCAAFLGNDVAFEKDGADIISSFSDYEKRSFSDFPGKAEIYPRGWTGKIGTHLDYMNGAHAAAAAAVYEHFSTDREAARLLDELYPDLRTEATRLASASQQQ